MKKIFLLIFITFSLFAFPLITRAAGVGIDPLLRPDNAPAHLGESLSGDAQTRSESQAGKYTWEGTRALLIMKIISNILGLAGIVAVFFIVQNGFWMIASGGKEETITQHKKGLTWAVVGLILIILSYSIIRFIISVPYAADQAPATPPTTQGS